MMTRKRNCSIVAALLMLCSCTIKNTYSIKNAEWLVGTWEHKTSKGSIYETWKKINRNELSGYSYMIKNKDTIIFETIRLVNEHGKIFYIPAVNDQNSGAPVRFSEKKISGPALTFENKMHDFPQVISYIRIGNDSLKAEISGLRNGKDEHRYFPMSRLK
ncbi:DUF6265 family protein [Epilithonimonas sp. JDS]|uniref:DUF6265 family protein n=1 Tax=Epilithonimonas sp. JDS TaxID=2902797 RepID=UPI001E2DBEB0|nr:DUF6265 family protein [Epilithonimonas sp. JDS]MCD9855489.1 DUF6265 family protein [Epilithonimonas sp. JDS]